MPPPTAPTVRWRLATPTAAPGSAGAIAVFHLEGDIDVAAAALGIGPVRAGEVRLRRFADVDTGVVARPAPGCLLLMPHAGPAVVRRMGAWLVARGVMPGAVDDPRTLYPEAQSLIEARMLDTLARAASPLAIDLLLDQPRRWTQHTGDAHDAAVLVRSRLLNRLVTPPTVVALGPPNIGKSTLLNALAKRGVAIVAGQPGTTRDHVGVRLDLGGLVVTYIDTPGIDAAGGGDSIQREAQELALAAAASADLVLLCADATSGFVAPPTGSGAALRVGLRADLGAARGAEIVVSARSGEGMAALVAGVRERLVPGAALGHPGPWQFWA